MDKEVPRPFSFKHIKTPAWAKKSDIYFIVLTNNNQEIAYIGLQSLDFQLGVCNNICYKTFLDFRGNGWSKYYLFDFIRWQPFDFDIIKAFVKEENIASCKMLEYCGFTKKLKEQVNGYIKNRSFQEKIYIYKLKKYNYIKEIGEKYSG